MSVNTRITQELSSMLDLDQSLHCILHLETVVYHNVCPQSSVLWYSFLCSERSDKSTLQKSRDQVRAAVPVETLLPPVGPPTSPLSPLIRPQNQHDWRILWPVPFTAGSRSTAMVFTLTPTRSVICWTRFGYQFCSELRRSPNSA